MGRHVLRLVVLLTLMGTPAFASHISLARAIPTTITVPDDSPTIQTAINDAVDGDTVLVRTGTYYEHVVVNKTISLVGEDRNTTIIDGNGTGHVIHVVRDHVTITGFTVQRGGSNAFPDLDAGICLNGTSGCIVTGNLLVDNGCFGLHLLNSDGNTVSGNTFLRNALFALELSTSTNNTIASNIAMATPNIGLGMHASSHNNTLLGNTVTNCTYGISLNNVRDSTISGNHLANNSEIGIWMQERASDNTISENTVAGSRYDILIERANGNTISGNTLTDGESGIRIQGATYTEIYNNTIAHHYGGAWDAGIRLDAAGHSRIHANRIVDNGRGILLYATSPYVSIHRNNITDNEFAIRVASGGSHYLNVTSNIVLNNRGYGIGVTGFNSGSHYATITRNLIMNNSDGIALGQYSNFNTILRNNITQNGYGLYIEYSMRNTIIGNNIIDNDQQVHLTSSVNTWDGGYPTGGNYWSDYTGVDMSRGPYQNETGQDCLGDTPYVIDGNNLDRYPLTHPRDESLSADINHDGIVDIFDLVRVALAFGSEPGDPTWNPQCDMNHDGAVDIFDVGLAALHFGETPLIPD
jgi:parallel beta-helix repeat protein